MFDTGNELRDQKAYRPKTRSTSQHFTTSTTSTSSKVLRVVGLQIVITYSDAQLAGYLASSALHIYQPSSTMKKQTSRSHPLLRRQSHKRLKEGTSFYLSGVKGKSAVYLELCLTT